MSCIALLDLRKAEELHYFMSSLVVTWSQHTVVKERNLHGRPMQDVGAEADVFNPQVATVNDNEMDILNKCVAMMYKSSTTTGVNNARLDMFARKQRPYQGIPPTRSALL